MTLNIHITASVYCVRRSSHTNDKPCAMHYSAKDIIAGSCAGMASTATMYPMDTVRTRLQVSGSSGRFKGVWSCVSNTIKHEGVRALYKGLAMPLSAQLLFKSVIFCTNGYANRVLAKRGLEGTAVGTFACGALSGGVNAFFIAPVELVRTRLMLQYGRRSEGSSSTTGPVDCIRQVVRRNGVLGMWQGLRITITRDCVGLGAFFLAFGKMKEALMKHHYGGEAKGHPPPPLPVLLLSGTTAGLTYWGVALPLDTIKTVTQALDRERGMRVPGMIETCRNLVREGGAARLVRGWPVAFARGVPGAAIMLTTHAKVTQFLEESWQAVDTVGRLESPSTSALLTSIARK